MLYTKSDINDNIKSLSNIKKHLDRFSDIITSDNKPYGLHRARDQKFFVGEKIVSLRKCSVPTFCLTDFDCYLSQTYYIIKTTRVNLKFLTGTLNSKVVAYWLRFRGKMQGDLFQIDKDPILNIPIPNAGSDEQKEVANLVDEITRSTSLKNIQVNKFLNLLSTDFGITPNKQLQSYYTLTYSQFLEELAKAKAKISLQQKSEWQDYFDSAVKTIRDLNSQTEDIDSQIDNQITRLYGLEEVPRIK